MVRLGTNLKQEELMSEESYHIVSVVIQSFAVRQFHKRNPCSIIQVIDFISLKMNAKPALSRNKVIQ